MVTGKMVTGKSVLGSFSSSALAFVGPKKEAFSMTYKKNSSFKRILSQALNLHTLDGITF